MKRLPSQLETMSGYLFMLGTLTSKLSLVTSKLKRTPFTTISGIANLASLILFTIGYVFWYFGTLFQSSSPRKKDSWYGFVEYKQQFQMSAILGLIGTVMSLIMPTSLLVPASWLFLLSNVIWSIGEYHKKNMPPTNIPQFNVARQTIYCHFTLGITTLNLIAAITATALLFFPLATAVIVPVSVALSLLTLTPTLYKLAHYHFGDFSPKEPLVIATSAINVPIATTTLSKPTLSSPTPSPEQGKHFPSILTPVNASASLNSRSPQNLVL